MATKRLAVLIDGDNLSSELADALFTEVAKLGTGTIKRVYGGHSAICDWREKARAYGISLRETMPGKNATDMELAIDAMDLLHRGKLDRFCIVSSDSDFAPLARRLREDGVTVSGFGESKAADGFRRACDEFVVLSMPATVARTAVAQRRTKAQVAEIIVDDRVQRAALELKSSCKVPAARQPNKSTHLSNFRELFSQAMARLGNSATEVTLGVIGYQVRRVDKDFDVKRYGAKNLKTLVLKSGLQLVQRDGISRVVVPKLDTAA